MHHRKDINELSQQELETYIHALGILRERSRVDPEDPTGTDFQARLHNDMEVGPCEHGNDLFFAWHRCHLYHFERLLQQSDPPGTAEVAIPYWDWSRPDPVGARYPQAFLSEPALTAARLPDGAPLAADTIDIVKRERNWNEFGGWPRDTPGRDYGVFELGPHNYTHGRYIGGLMGNPETAAEDPIYFSFHCFIDLLWAEWQRRNPDQSATSPTAPLRGFAGQSMNRVSDFQSITALGHDYIYNEGLRRQFSEPSAPRISQPLADAGSLAPLFQGTLQTRFAAHAQADFAVPPLSGPVRKVVLVLRDLSVPKVASFQLDIFVHPRRTPVTTMSADEAKPFHVGYVALWKAHAHSSGHGHHGTDHAHRPQHHPTVANARVDATSVIQSLQAQGESDLVSTLIFRPAPLPSGAPAPLSELTREVELRDFTMEVAP